MPSSASLHSAMVPMDRVTAPNQQLTSVATAHPHPHLSRHLPHARSRRVLLLSVAPVLPLAWQTSVLPPALLPSGLLDELSPQSGNCPTCIGEVDGTLGSCSGLSACSSSYDDRPAHFVAPWEVRRRTQHSALWFYCMQLSRTSHAGAAILPAACIMPLHLCTACNEHQHATGSAALQPSTYGISQVTASLLPDIIT